MPQYTHSPGVRSPQWEGSFSRIQKCTHWTLYKKCPPQFNLHFYNILQKTLISKSPFTLQEFAFIARISCQSFQNVLHLSYPTPTLISHRINIYIYIYIYMTFKRNRDVCSSRVGTGCEERAGHSSLWVKSYATLCLTTGKPLVPVCPYHDQGTVWV